MKNSYIKSYLNCHNEFRAFASLYLFGTLFTNVNVKIDTGCSSTTFLTSKLGLPKAESQRLKLHDCNDKSIKKIISFGVNDSKAFREKSLLAFRTHQYEHLTCVSFVHKIKNLEIAGTPTKNSEVKVNYDRTGNILIGMDIISTWDTHIGKINYPGASTQVL